MNKRKLPELLAPAGGYEQMVAAVQNGADAVYLGGKVLNARIKADNFEESEFEKALEYAHARGVKLYLTLNTLLRDNEIEVGLKYAEWAYSNGFDALILQDLGFGKLIKECIPDIELHLSTQGTVYNIDGLKQAEKLGYSRAILSREMTLEEINEVTTKSGIETEVFVHGALCISYSGQCQMSNFIGGRSGNRGLCAQPCRLPYERLYNGIKMTGSKYPLSPKDLCSINMLSEIVKTGVSSLKIEGRMKSPEYVAIVTRLYRKYLDEPSPVTDNDFKELKQVFNRGGFCSGYLKGEKGGNIISGDSPKHTGIEIGYVAGFNTKNKTVDIKLADDLSLGDGVEIRNENLPGNVVTFMRKEGKMVKIAHAGDTVTVGDIVGKMKKGEIVSKITDKVLMEKARLSYKKQIRKTGVDMSFKASLCGKSELIIKDDLGNNVSVFSEGPAEKALYRATTVQDVSSQLSKTGDTPFELRKIEVLMNENIIIPSSQLNKLRRDGLAELQKKRCEVIRPPGLSGQYIFNQNNKKELVRESQDIKKCLYYYRFEESLTDIIPADRIYLPYQLFLNEEYNDLFTEYRKIGTELIASVPTITKGFHDKNINIRTIELKDLYTKGIINGVSVGTLNALSFFLDLGIKIYGDHGLNVYNSETYKLLVDSGIDNVLISHELSVEDATKLNFTALPEFSIYGTLPLMALEHCPAGCNGNKTSEECSVNNKKYYCIKGETILQDRKGQQYPIVSEPDSCTVYVLSGKKIDLLNKRKELNAGGIFNFRYYIFGESSKNIINMFT